MSSCILKYVVKGVPVSRSLQAELKAELMDALPSASSVLFLPIVDGYSVEIEMEHLGGFSQQSFEPYVADQVLPDAVRAKTGVVPELQLIKVRYS